LVDAREAIRLDPDNVSAYVKRSVARIRLDDFKGALVDVNEAIRLDPDNVSAYVDRGICYFDQGNLEAAQSDFNVALQHDPRHAFAIAGRASVALQNKDYERALTECETALKIDAELLYASDCRGMVRADQNDLVGAQADFESMRRISPESSATNSRLAWLALLKGNYDDAIAEATKAIGMNPRNDLAHYSRGAARAAKGDHVGAVADFRQTLVYWTNIHTKRGDRFFQEMQSYLDQWGNEPRPDEKL